MDLCGFHFLQTLVRTPGWLTSYGNDRLLDKSLQLLISAVDIVLPLS